MKKIHIQISYNTEQEMQKIKRRYHVSYSTICDILLNEMYISIMNESTDLSKDYMEMDKKHQSTIFINDQNVQKYFKTFNLEHNQIVKLISNALFIYTKDLIPSAYPKDAWTKIKCNIGNKLANARDKYWNYNDYYRNLVRAKKQYEKEYQETK